MLRRGGDPGGSHWPLRQHRLGLLRVTDSESEESHGLHPRGTQQGAPTGSVSPRNHAGGTLETAQAARPLGAPASMSSRRQVAEPRCSGRGEPC